jgi:putative transposase
LAEVFIRINGQQHYLWRAVDQDGDVIDILVQAHRDQRAAERFFRRLLHSQGAEPLQIIADKLRSYSAAIRTVFGNSDSQCRAIRQQSSRSLASADAPTGAANATIQIC